MKIEVKLKPDGLVEDIQRSEKLDWIAAYREKVAKNPVLPDVFLPVVNKYEKGEPISQDIEVIPISGQQWHNLTQSEKNQLLELIEFTGQSAEEYTRSWQIMLPRNPRGK